MQTIHGHETRCVRLSKYVGENSRLVGDEWQLTKFAYVATGRLLLDTSLGLAISGRDILTFANSSLLEQVATPIKPMMHKWALAQVRHDYVPTVVWVPYGSGNYFHFMNDLVAGLVALHERSLLNDGTPILVHRKVHEAAFFKEALELSSFLSTLNWRQYDSAKWILCSTLVTAKTFYSAADTLASARKVFDRLPPFKSVASDKIFVSRQGYRTASNLEDLHAVARGLGFKVVFFEHMSLPEQFATINRSRVIAGLHGASFTNLAFHHNPHSALVVEVFAGNYFNPCYSYLAQDMGFAYRYIFGSEMNASKNHSFFVEPERLAAVLRDV